MLIVTVKYGHIFYLFGISMLEGCYTALITPMLADGALDSEGLRRLVEYQSANGISGVLAVGTTGESPTLDWREHMRVIARVNEYSSGKSRTIAGTGANSTEESVHGTLEAIDLGVETILLVDPYYNGPSSVEIRREYYEPIVRKFPNATFIPYIIPGRTGAMLLPADLAILSRSYSNVSAVKEATGDLENMRSIRRLCGPDFCILSGDDDMTIDMMGDSSIDASGVISVVSNILPGAMSEMVSAHLGNDVERARRLEADLKPLIGIVTVKTEEETPYGKVVCKARNPLATKTLMNILGMPAGPCRPPLGKMTRTGISRVVESARSVYAARSDLFKPLEDFFAVDVGERLSGEKYREGLYYESY